MAGENFFKFNIDKQMDYSTFKMEIDKKSVADENVRKLFNIFDVQKEDGTAGKDGILSGKEVQNLWDKVRQYAAKNQKDTNPDKDNILDKEETAMLLEASFGDDVGSLKDKGFNANTLINALNTIQEKIIPNKQPEYKLELIKKELPARPQPTMTEAEFNKIKKEAFNIILTSSSVQEKTAKDYADIFVFAKEKLSKSGKNPTVEEINRYGIELQMLNPDIKADKKIKKGTPINLPDKSIEKKNLQLLESKGIKVAKENYLFFQKLLELDDKKQAIVLDAIRNSKSSSKEGVINEVFSKTKINLADTGLTVKVGNSLSTIENFITGTLKLDLNSKEGLKIYDRLSRLGQKILDDDVTKEFFAKLSTMNNMTFDKLADKAEAFGILNLKHIPKFVYLDNGKAFRGKYFVGSSDFDEIGFKGIYEKLGITTVFANPYNARSKVIERFWKEMQESFEKLLPSYIGTSIKNKPARLRRNEKFHSEMHQELLFADVKRVRSSKTTDFSPLPASRFIPTIQQTIQMINSWLEYKNSLPCANCKDKNGCSDAGTY